MGKRYFDEGSMEQALHDTALAAGWRVTQRRDGRVHYRGPNGGGAWIGGGLCSAGLWFVANDERFRTLPKSGAVSS